MKTVKKHTEQAMREAAIKNGCKGRSITYEAVGRANRYCGQILDEFLLFVEQSMPPLGGRGTRIQKENVENAYNRFRVALFEALRNASWNLEEEE
jgi:hypothetical protein